MGSSSPFGVGIAVLTTGETDIGRRMAALPLGLAEVLGTLKAGEGCAVCRRAGAGVVVGFPPAPTVVHAPPPGGA